MNEIFNLVIDWLTTEGLRIIFVFLGAWVITKLINKSVDRVIRKLVKPDAYATQDAEQKREDTLIKVASTTINVLVWVMTFMLILSELGLNIGPLLAGAGVAGLALGFGGQYLIRDVLSGLFIILENQYRVGDVICIGDTCGAVEDINLRVTVIRDLDGVVHHVPNGEVKIASNLSKDFSRVNLNIGVSYDADLDKVEKIVNEVGEELAQDKDWKKSIKSPPKFLRVYALGDSAVEIKILGDVMPLKQWEVTGELRKRLKIAFDKNRIEIPYPQQVIHQAKK